MKFDGVGDFFKIFIISRIYLSVSYKVMDKFGGLIYLKYPIINK
jgi:hypothetical protein